MTSQKSWITRSQVRYCWVRILPKAIFLSPNKTETMFMIFFTPNIVILIFLGLLEAISSLLFALFREILCPILCFFCSCFFKVHYVHLCSGFYVDVQVSEYKMSGYFWVAMKLK